jgi:hypothetical protein
MLDINNFNINTKYMIIKLFNLLKTTLLIAGILVLIGFSNQNVDPDGFIDPNMPQRLAKLTTQK